MELVKNNRPEPKVLPQASHTHVPSARIVAEFIKTGTPQNPTPTLIPPWDMLYQAVGLTKGVTQDDRWHAFLEASSHHPDHFGLRILAEKLLDPDHPGSEAHWYEPQPKYYPDHFSAAYAVQPHPPISWLVQDFIAQPGLSFVVGHSGSKKSYAILDLAVSIALGKPWLGHQTKQAGVVWIDEEGGPHRIFKRLAQVMRAHNAPEDIPIRIYPNQQFDLFSPFHIEALMTSIEYLQAALLVLDPFSAFLPHRTENAVQPLTPIFNILRTLILDTNIAIILIHHTNKEGFYRGSTHLHNTVDLMLMASSPLYTPYIEFNSVKTRDTPPLHFAAHLNLDPPDSEPQRAWLTAADLPLAQYAFRTGQEPSPAASHILSYLHKHGPSPATAVTKDTPSTTETQARTALYKLIDLNLIYRVNKGGKGSPAIYALSN